MLTGYSVDTFYSWHYATLLAVAAHFQVLLHHIALLGLQHEACYLEITETGRFHFTQEVIAKVFYSVVCLKLVLKVYYMFQAFKEPCVYLGEFLHTLYAVSLFERLGYSEDS